jgi:hypothetical protein
MSTGVALRYSDPWKQWASYRENERKHKPEGLVEMITAIFILAVEGRLIMEEFIEGKANTIESMKLTFEYDIVRTQ